MRNHSSNGKPRNFWLLDVRLIEGGIIMFVNDVIIDWNKINADSYLRNIDAISGVDKISFKDAHFRHDIAHWALERLNK